MKFGAHCYIFTDEWTDDSAHILDQAKALGLGCVEISIGDDVVFNASLMRKYANQLDIELLVSPGAAWPLSCDISSEIQAEREAGIKWHKQQINLTAELGSSAYSGAIYGHTGVVKRRRPHPDEYRWMADGLHQLASYGVEMGVQIVIEPMSHFRTHLVNTPAQAMQLINKADHDNLNILFDTYHMVTEITDYAAGLDIVKDRLWGIHACENNRGVPGRGIIPWQDIFRTLNANDFDGYMMLESYNSSIGDFAFSRGMFHNVCPDAVGFVTEGIKFLKNGLESEVR